MTTLGVVFGALVLVFSLSLGQGVQSTLARESHRNEFLRKIIVHPSWRGREADVSKEEVQVPGKMSEEKRQRLRQAIAEQKLQNSSNLPHVALTRERLQALGSLEHVESVTPLVQQGGWAVFGDHSQFVRTVSADVDYAKHRQRLIAGDFFQGTDERSAVVSELTCYRLGVTDDADVERLIGKQLRLEFRNEPAPIGLNVWLFKGDGSEQTHEETTAAEKIRQQLPGMLDQFKLTAAEKEAVRPTAQKRRPSTIVHQEELTIVGIVRLPTKEEQESAWDSTNRDADILLPRQTAVEMFFRQNNKPTDGVAQATILVDREENVKAVLRHVQEMNLEAYAPIEYIERERFIYLLIFTTMACVAAVALLVAALVSPTPC